MIFLTVRKFCLKKKKGVFMVDVTFEVTTNDPCPADDAMFGKYINMPGCRLGT